VHGAEAGQTEKTAESIKIMNCQTSFKVCNPPMASFFAPGFISAAVVSSGARHA